MTTVAHTTNPHIKEIIQLIDMIEEIGSQPAQRHAANSPVSPAASDQNSSYEQSLNWLRRFTPALMTLKGPRIGIYAGLSPLVTTFPSLGANSEYVKRFIETSYEGTNRLNLLAEQANTDLRIYEMPAFPRPSSGTPSSQIAGRTPPMDDEELAIAFSYGMMTIEPETDFYATTVIGAGQTESAEALIKAHTERSGHPAQSMIVGALLAANQDRRGLDSLKAIGTAPIAALCGAIVAARLARMPILLEGPIGIAAALVLKHHCPHITEHCAFTGHMNQDDLHLAEDMLYIPAPYKEATEPGHSSACLIPQFRNELVLKAPVQ